MHNIEGITQTTKSNHKHVKRGNKYSRDQKKCRSLRQKSPHEMRQDYLARLSKVIPTGCTTLTSV